MNGKALRRQLPALRRRARERVQQLPQVRQAKRRKRWKLFATTALLILIACLAQCDCGHHATSTAQVAPASIVAPPKHPVPAPRRRVRARTDPHARPGFATADSTTPPWLEQFHMQVAARSTRLAECFDGAERPGALRWATFVNGDTGKISESELEAMGAGADVSQSQKTCLLKALADPPYRLDSPNEALPRRVSLVIEF
ncbi:MAG: hypothetical protein ACT4TC_11615 [Myxococcaceae bacterium]